MAKTNYTAEQYEQEAKDSESWRQGITSAMLRQAAQMMRQRAIGEPVTFEEAANAAEIFHNAQPKFNIPRMGVKTCDWNGCSPEWQSEHIRRMRAALESFAAGRGRVPDGMRYPKLGPEQDACDGFVHDMYECGFADGWNACRNAMLAAAPNPTHNTPEGTL